MLLKSAQLEEINPSLRRSEMLLGKITYFQVVNEKNQVKNCSITLHIILYFFAIHIHISFVGADWIIDLMFTFCHILCYNFKYFYGSLRLSSKDGVSVVLERKLINLNINNGNIHHGQHNGPRSPRVTQFGP